jgi:hypothetical protein
MVYYLSQIEHLKIIMNLLRHKSHHIQWEAFHIFKLFVANPKKTLEITWILYTNQQKLLSYLQPFHEDNENIQFVEEKKIVLDTIAELQCPVISSSSTEENGQETLLEELEEQDSQQQRQQQQEAVSPSTSITISLPSDLCQEHQFPIAERLEGKITITISSIYLYNFMIYAFCILCGIIISFIIVISSNSSSSSYTPLETASPIFTDTLNPQTKISPTTSSTMVSNAKSITSITDEEPNHSDSSANDESTTRILSNNDTNTPI